MLNQPEIKIEYGQILEKWNDIYESYKETFERIADDVFRRLKACIFEKILQAVNNDNRLIGYDEKIFEYLEHLMGYYQKISEYYTNRKADFTSDSLVKLLDGLNSLIVSRINQFSEYLTLTNNSADRENSTNPILTEKKQILEKQTKVFVGRMDALKREIKGCGIPVSSTNQRYILEYITDKYINDLHSFYAETVKSCVDGLNDLYERDVTEFYYELLNEEKEHLTTIMKIQVAAIEKEPKTPAENLLVGEMLSIIRECYQYGDMETGEIAESFKKAEQRGAAIRLEETDAFRKSILELEFDDDADVTQLADKYADFKKTFAEIFDKFVEDRLNSSALNLYLLKRNVTEEQLLSKELNDVFSGICHYTAQNKEALTKGEYKEIIEGITETVEIKTENIQDSTETFAAECDKIFEYKADVSKSERQGFIEDVMGQFISVCSAEDTGQRTAEDAITQYASERFKNILDKKQKNQADLISKKIFDFDREQLLYEISTFEEILNHSVVRMREQTDEAIAEYVRFIDGAAMQIEKILRKYNIDVIRPTEHDLFNGKEHEVLIAEKNSSFNKGEIIKLMNSGYRRNGVVMMRANVIAAK